VNEKLVRARARVHILFPISLFSCPDMLLERKKSNLHYLRYQKFNAKKLQKAQWRKGTSPNMNNFIAKQLVIFLCLQFSCTSLCAFAPFVASLR
jgi:hypothetical protein